jgi:hypothetical protein
MFKPRKEQPRDKSNFVDASQVCGCDACRNNRLHGNGGICIQANLQESRGKLASIRLAGITAVPRDGTRENGI